MNRVTDFRIDTVEIPLSKFYELPARTQELIHGQRGQYYRPLRIPIPRSPAPVVQSTDEEQKECLFYN